LIEQNFEVLKMVWPNAPAGIFSAGLKRKETAFPIIFAGLQSAIKDPTIFGHRDLIWIDEAHMVNQDQASMYLKFIAAMKLINPAVKVVGMSATLFRMGQGWITDSGLFTDVVYDMTGLHGFNKLIEEGHLATLIPKRTKTELDVSGVQIVKGEYAQGALQKAVDREEITLAGLRELVEAGYNRKSWLIFASGIEHSDHIAAMLENFGIECASVHSKQKPEYNDGAIKAFKNFELRAISNYGKLTTGFNHPGIDLIGMFRPTMSIPLWVQMLGRGTRPANGKNDCLVLDFARNTPRLGCINDPAIPKKKGDKVGDAPVKICEACGAYNYASARTCCSCGIEFQFQVKIVAKAGTDELLRTDTPIIETFPVDYVIYARQENKMGKPPYIRATYFCGLQAFKQNVFPQHGGMSRKFFREWWRQRSKEEPPLTTDDALRFVSTLRKPKTIRVHVNLRYPEITQVEY
jgi:DNA repair protein RadD